MPLRTDLKKNLLKWLKIKEYGFEESSCFSCKNSADEKDELIDGVPFCLKEGYCKHLKNVKSVIKQEGLEGNPLNFYEAGGLRIFEELSEQIYSLSPYDGLKLPTATFYPYMEGHSDMSAIEFVSLLAVKTNYIRNSILSKRIQEANFGHN